MLATAGRNIPLDEMTTLLSVSAAAMDEAVLELIQRDIVALDGNTLEFRNDLHRLAAYSMLAEEARKYMHAHLAQHLSAAKDQGEFQHALEAAHHFLEAGWIEEAQKLVCLGAERAISCGAPKEAEEALEAVAAQSSHEDAMPIILLQARTLSALGKFESALATLEAWQPISATVQEHAHAACVRLESLHRGRFEEDASIEEALDRALALAEESGDAGLLLTALQLSAELASEAGNSEALASVKSRTLRIGLSSSHASANALAKLSQGYCSLVAGDPVKADEEFGHCVEALKPLHLDPELRKAYNGIGIAAYCRGAFDEAITAFEQAIELSTRIGNSVAAATSWSNLGAVHEDLGNLVQTKECYDAALELGEIATNPRRAVEYHLNAAGLKLLTGARSDASDLVAVARAWAEKSKLWWLDADVLLAAADLQLAWGRPTVAWGLFEQAQRKMMGRNYALSNRGRYERLRRHHLFATKGLPSLLQAIETGHLTNQCLQLTGRLEALAFEEWARAQLDYEPQKVGLARKELQDRGMLGVLMRLDALGYAPKQ
jgi:tetratricopeptide (TPR) repeat protein